MPSTDDRAAVGVYNLRHVDVSTDLCIPDVLRTVQLADSEPGHSTKFSFTFSHLGEQAPILFLNGTFPYSTLKYFSVSGARTPRPE